MRRDFKIEEFFRCLFYLLNARIAEFKNFIAILANEMVVLFVGVSSFKLRLVAAELVASHQPAFQQ